MRRFILEIFIFTLISMLCFSVFGQDWQDEDHVWNEEKGEWEVHNKAGGRVNQAPKVDKAPADMSWQNGEEWERFLPKNVKRGKRTPTNWEVSEAKRKLWAKEMMTVRAMQKAAQRRQLIAYRKASGWYAARQAGAHNMGNWMLQYHINAVMRTRNGY